MDQNLRKPLKFFMQARVTVLPVPFIKKCQLFLADKVLACQNSILAFLRYLIYKRQPRTIRSILIFRTGSLGDSLCAIPTIQSIHKQYPQAAIDVLTNTGKKNLAGLNHLIDKSIYREIIDYNGYSKLKLITFLRQRNYDLVVQLPQVDAGFYPLLRDLIVFRTIAPAGFGWYKSQIKWFRKTQARHLQFPNEIERLSKLLQRHGIVPHVPDTILYPSSNDLEYAKKILEELGVYSFKNLIAIVVGAKRVQNRWPIDYFKEVVTYFSSGYQLLLIGAGEDNALVQELSNIKNVVNVCGRFTPVQSAAVISLCRLTISNDTGPMHLSYAVGTPTIALFSSRDLPGKWFPPEENNRVFRAEKIACEACFSEICNNNICMQAIKPSDVIKTAEELLARQNIK
jgi:ADP-heptose:LPS heptosyltransferase